MNEFEIDKLIGNDLKGQAAGEGFKARVFQESTAAFVQGKIARRRLQITGVMLVILLIAAGAFVCGQLSVRRRVIPEQENWANVPRELVAWLDAGRFFEQLGMGERAERAYRKAGELIPREAVEIMHARLYGERVYAGLVAGPQGAERCREVSVQARCGLAEVGAVRKTERLNGILSRIIGDYLGG